MSDELTKDVYLQYAKKIVSVLSGEQFFNQYRNRVDSGVSSFKLIKKRLVQDISLDWIDNIERTLPFLDTIVRNPRKFIVQEEDIVDISLAKSISTESVKHLAQHTNMISKVDADGTVTPNRILNITKEESFEIYENRFLYTLLLKLKDFVTLRYDKIKKASATQEVLEMNVESRFNLPSKKIIYRTEYFAQLSFDEVMQLEPETLTKIERIAKIDRIITDFLSSSFAKSMRNSAPVRPPITRTNVILKEQNFKKALELWQFVETYKQTGGFSTSDDIEDYPIEDTSMVQLKDMITLNTMLFESMYNQHETDFDMKDAEFADLLRVGEMQFQPDELQRDEYAQKPEDEQLNQEEEKKEEVKPEVAEDAEDKKPKDAESENAPDEGKEEEKEPEKEPEKADEDAEKDKTEAEKDKTEAEISEEKAEKDKTEAEISEEKASEDAEKNKSEQGKEGEEADKDDKLKPEKEETPVDKDLEVEAPPKEEVDDTEPDADEFDQHLFDVRKIYKRPKDDKLRMEEVAKIKDAIDRCLNTYRKFKQEELDARDSEYRRRRQREEIEKRAEAFRKQRDAVVAKGQNSGSIYFGQEAFQSQSAKITPSKLASSKSELSDNTLQKTKKSAKENSDLLKVKSENLELEDKTALPNYQQTIAKQPEKQQRSVAKQPEKQQQSVAKQPEKQQQTSSKQPEKQQQSASQQRQSAMSQQQTPAKPIPLTKPKQAIKTQKADERELHETTLNQKYSQPKGKNKQFKPIDEARVAVGGIRIADTIIDPFAEFEAKIVLPKKPKKTDKNDTENGVKTP